MADDERERGGGDDGMRETERRAREGWTVPESFFFFHNASGAGGRSAPEVFSSPLLSLTLLLSPPGISLRKTHRP